MIPRRRQLLDLSEDILHLIAVNLRIDSPASLISLARVSRAIHRIAISQLYHTITLSDFEDSDQDRTTRILELSNSESQYRAEFLRGLVFAVFDAESRESSLNEFIKKLPHLNTLSWQTSQMIPIVLLDHLEKEWPRLELSVANWDVNHRIPTNAPLLERVTSSPLLRSLEFTVNWSSVGSGVGSFLSSLSRAVSQNFALRTFKLEVYPTTGYFEADTVGPADSLVAEPLADGVQIPNLTSLRIFRRGNFPFYTPALNILSSFILQEAVKWSHIDCLHLGGLPPDYAYQHLIHRAPNLKTFELWYGPEKDPGNHEDVESEHPLRAHEFISSMIGLEELRIVNHAPDVEAFWAPVCSQAASLRILAVHTAQIPGQTYSPQFIPAKLLQQLDTFHLAHLEIDIPLEDVLSTCRMLSNSEAAAQQQSKSDGESHLQTIAASTRLQSLKVWVEIPMEDSTFRDAEAALANSDIPISIHRARFAAATILRHFCRLQKGELRFHRLQLCFILRFGHEYYVTANRLINSLDEDGASDPDVAFGTEIRWKWGDEIL